MLSGVEGEDLTRQMIDADASLKAKRTLRDRLQTLLERHDGELADLLAVEKSLSDTQQELDSATALMDELRQRVDFSKVTLHYSARAPLNAREEARPLHAALASAASTFGRSLAALITFVVGAAPWLVLLGLITTGLIALRRRRRRARISERGTSVAKVHD